MEVGDVAEVSQILFDVGRILAFTAAALAIIVGVKWWLEQWPKDPPIRRA